jgi:hypothetical protein
LALPENDALQKLERLQPSPLGLPESGGHPQAVNWSHVIHWTEKPAGRPVPPEGAQTVTVIVPSLLAEHEIVGVVIFGFGRCPGVGEMLLNVSIARAMAIMIVKTLFVFILLSSLC